jgi:uncharacterized DUF497 family protein
MDEFEWDEAKRETNRLKHGVDFDDAVNMFDGRPVLNLAGRGEAEPRIVTIGIVEGIYYAVIWTKRGDKRRIISCRRARHEERREYRQLHGG